MVHADCDAFVLSNAREVEVKNDITYIYAGILRVFLPQDGRRGSAAVRENLMEQNTFPQRVRLLSHSKCLYLYAVTRIWLMRGHISASRMSPYYCVYRPA